MIPLLLPLGLLAGSTVANTIAARQQDRAVADRMAAERIRQSGFDKEAYALNQQAQQRYEQAPQAQEQSVSDLQNMYAQATETPAPIALPKTSNIVSEHETKKRGEADAFTGQQADARARLNSFGDMLGDMSLGTARDASQLGMVGGLRRGSQNVLPMELDAAQQKGGTMRTIGDITGGLGQMLLMGSLTGAKMPGLGGLFGRSAPATSGLAGLY